MPRVDLKYPIQAEGKEIKFLDFPDRVKVKQLRVVDEVKGEIAKTIALASELTALPPSALDELDGADFVKVNEVVQGFM